MAGKGIGENNLAFLWNRIKEHFGISVDAQTIALWSSFGWDPPSERCTDLVIDEDTIAQFEEYGYTLPE